MSKHLMVDLETWGIGANAVPISIGAVKFQMDTPVSLENQAERLDAAGKPLPVTMDTFHCGIIPSSCKPYGMDIDPDTIMWWLDEQRTEARRAWLGLEKHDIGTVMMAFVTFINAASPDEYQVWGNGALFDNAIMRSAMTKVIGEPPWGFRSDRCYRTLDSVYREQQPSDDLVPKDFGIPHSALADALFQADRLQQIYQRLGWK